MTRLSYLQQIVQWHDFQNVTLTTCLQTLWRKHCLTSNTTRCRQLWFTIRRYYIQHSLRFTDRGSRPQNGSFGRTLGAYHLPGSVEENWAESISSRYRTAVHGTHSVISHLAISICGTGGIFSEQSTRPTIRNLLDRRFGTSGDGFSYFFFSR